LDRPLDWRHFTGGHISLKKSLLEKANGFDETRFGFADGREDWEFGQRLYDDHGLQIRYAREAVTEHYHWRTPKQVVDKAFAEGRSTAQWVSIHPETSRRVLAETPHLRFLGHQPPLRERIRRMVVNSWTAPFILATARRLERRWEQGSAFLYSKTHRHFALAGFREGLRSNPPAGLRTDADGEPTS